MALNVNVNDVILKIRRESDIETASESTSICTDAELTVWLNDAYRALYELVAAETGEEHFGKSATVSPTAWTLPSDSWRVLGIDWSPDGTLTSGIAFPFGERNSRQLAIRPRFRVEAGALIWEPAAQAPTTAVTLRYVPTPATLAGGGSFDSFLGWDTYVVLWVKLKVYAKQQYPLEDVAAELSACERRVRRGAVRIGGYGDVIADERGSDDSWYYNG
jgi:hypothetical protein